MNPTNIYIFFFHLRSQSPKKYDFLDSIFFNDKYGEICGVIEIQIE